MAGIELLRTQGLAQRPKWVCLENGEKMNHACVIFFFTITFFFAIVFDHFYRLICKHWILSVFGSCSQLKYSILYGMLYLSLGIVRPSLSVAILLSLDFLR